MKQGVHRFVKDIYVLIIKIPGYGVHWSVEYVRLRMPHGQSFPTCSLVQTPGYVTDYFVFEYINHCTPDTIK